MRTVDFRDGRPAFQGDIMITLADCLPAGGTLRADNIVAHSETGHHHVAVGGRVYDGANPMLLHIVAERAQVELRHMREYDTHETIALVGGPGAVYEVRRQREHTPEGWRRVED